MLHMEFPIRSLDFIKRFIVLTEVAVAVSSDRSERRDALFWGTNIASMKIKVDARLSSVPSR